MSLLHLLLIPTTISEAALWVTERRVPRLQLRPDKRRRRGLRSPPRAKTARGQSLRPGSSCGCWLTVFPLDGVNALFVSGNTIKPTARAFAGLLSELRATLDNSAPAHRRDSAAFPAVIDTIPSPHPCRKLRLAKHATPTVRPRAGGSSRVSVPCAEAKQKSEGV